jgi:hypothetical protein
MPAPAFAGRATRGAPDLANWGYGAGQANRQVADSGELR